MRHSPIRSTAAAAAVVVAAAGIGTGAAFAAGASTTPSAPTTPAPHQGGHGHTVKLPPNATLQQIQAAAATDVSNQVTSLNAAITRVQKATDLGGDQATLLHMLQPDVPALQQLGQKIAADTTVPAARADHEQIFTNYRVYGLALPVTRLVIVADRADATAGPRLTKVAARIAAKETPANQAQVQPLLADLATQVGSATSATKGLPSTLEGYTPQRFNADKHLLDQAKGETKTAVGALMRARSDARQAAADVGLGHAKAQKGAATP